MTNDPLLDEVRRFRERNKKKDFEDAKAAASKASYQTQKRLDALYIFLYQLFRAVLWLYDKIVYPTLKLIIRPIVWIIKGYRWLWQKSTVKKDEFGIRRFSVSRAGIFLSLTVGYTAMLMLLANLSGFWVFYMLTVHHDDVVYLTLSQEIDSENNIFQTRGYRSLPLDDEEAIYYRSHPRLFNHVWSLVTTGNVFFPEYTSAVTPGLNKCIVTSYGFKWKWVVRNLDWNPELLYKKSCEYLGKLEDAKP